MRRAIILLLLRQAAAALPELEPLCDSLQGPRCAFVNDAAPRPHPEPPERVSSSWRERLLSLVRDHLATGRDEAEDDDAVRGAFEIRGDLPSEDGDFYLAAGQWLRQPEGWITVGLSGRFEDNCTLTGEITDDEGDVLEACSRFTLQRTEAPPPRELGGDPSFGLALVGAWEGVYVCAGTPTRLVLTLEPDHDVLASEVSGVFEFRVLGALNEYELREITRLVGESLLDATGESDEIILVEGDLADALFDADEILVELLGEEE